MEYVIIGNGIAGVSAVEAIRQLDRRGNITLVADEDHHPYCRPMISNLLAGSIAADCLAIRSPSFYDDLHINPVLGHRVEAIEPAERVIKVGRAGRSIPFDRLLIASGADPRILDIPGSQLPEVFCLRTQSQVQSILATAECAERAVVVGGGLVGLKAAHALQSRGLQVTMLIRSAHPLTMQVDKLAGQMILEKLRHNGLRVLVEAEVAEFNGQHGSLKFITLADGTEIPASLVVIAKGVTPSTSFVFNDQLSLGYGQGILIDKNMETTVAGIYAAGDVAETIDIARQTRRVNAIWPEAVQQGIIAGMNMAGRKVVYQGSLSRNVMRFYGLDVMTAGLVDPPFDDDRYEVISSLKAQKSKYHKLVFRHDRLVGMLLINDLEQGGVLSSLIRRGLPVQGRKERLLESGFQAGKLIYV
ncbi:MAG: FAD-dependent oxidoreductase [Pseudomonadota bacterium]|nr:FAD-dependent oxidoreductase [Pseudomonadota bacterium]